ncbi:hypothetical protein GLOTRDRAFT_115698 [Gloeophyllum trabeum ATCC 11539]|uniref:RING-type E3 ubiquitin transferase n=1 Tax=Gloeophyllum trabeum (strain ATCC 11539 / FP-39264 / Madison 617) TaxID=670483 RepID=S7RPH9_GLOTA|nr:uncharacterized protein GLOTRDRAFT_115698 [Gloeophyllum trabeum ATCC 11539]EPQ56445.1 hypothetical protein GLOTRDRAFT_115698 [Gloeophyllum trabeum ATCC 11539]
MNPEAPVFRPSTSKPRGVCKYYNAPRGCFAGDKCKFLHGETETITPYDRSKTCSYYAAGYCRRGDQCWFRHVLPDKVKAPEQAEGSTTADSQDAVEFEDVCSICYEKPITYGLLVGCSHVFCVKCIREWRDAREKSNETVTSGAIKKCPYCRVESRFITPSSVYYPEGHPGKEHAIQKYKESMARVPCRYFQKSPASDRFCPFGRDCFYQHQNDDGSPYVFDKGVAHYLPIYKRRMRREASSSTWRSADTWEEISATIQAISDSIPQLIWQNAGSDDDSDHEDEDEERDVARVNVETLERLASRVLASLTAMESIAQAARVRLDDDDEQAHPTETSLAQFIREAAGESEPSSASRPMSDSTSLAASSALDTREDTSGFPSFSSNDIDLEEDESYYTSDGSEGREGSEDAQEDYQHLELDDAFSVTDNLANALRESLQAEDLNEFVRQVASLGSPERSPALSSISEPREDPTAPTASSTDAEHVPAEQAVVGDPAGTDSSASIQSFQAEAGLGPPSRPEIQFNAKPTFVSDGRGRVVWSNSTRGRSGRDRGC